MRDFLKKEFLLGMGTGFIISALLVSLYGSKLPAAGENKDGDKTAEVVSPYEGGKEETDAGEPSKSTAPDAENTTQKPETDLAQEPTENSSATEQKKPIETKAEDTKPIDAKPKDTKPKDTKPTQYAEIIVKPGMTSETIAALLEKQGVIKDQEAFYKFITANKAHTKFKVGTFQVPVGGDQKEILAVLTKQRL